MNCIKVDVKNKRTIFTKEEIPKAVTDTDVIIKVAYSGVCGTDLHIIKGEFTKATDGVILGHESSGTIVEVSSKYPQFSVGDRVAVNPNLSCGICTPCKRLQTNFCQLGGPKYAIGVGVNGGWAEYVKAHVSQVTKLPENLSLYEAALCEPLSCIVHGLDEITNLDLGSNILIVGAGIIGMLWSCLFHTLGHKNVIILETDVNRQKIMSEAGLGYKCMSMDDIMQHRKDNAEYMVDVCISCRGNIEIMQTSLSLVGNGGTFLIFGVSAPQSTMAVNPFELYSKEITITAVLINTPNSFERAVSYLEAMSKTHLNMEKLGIGIFCLDEHEKAISALQKRSFTKIMFKL